MNIIWQSVAAAWRGLAAALRRAWAILGLAVLAASVAALGVLPPAAGFGILLICIAAAVISQVTLARQYLAETKPRSISIAALQVAASWLLAGIFLCILLSLVLVVAACLGYGTESAGVGFKGQDPTTWMKAVDGRGRIVLDVVAVVGSTGMAWVAGRIGLFVVATVAAGRIQMLSTWPLTRGRAWHLIAALVLALGPVGLVMAVLAAGNLVQPPISHVAQAVMALVIGMPLFVGVTAHFFQRFRAN